MEVEIPCVFFNLRAKEKCAHKAFMQLMHIQQRKAKKGTPTANALTRRS